MKDNTKNPKTGLEKESIMDDDFSSLDLSKVKKNRDNNNVLIPLSEKSRDGNSNDDKTNQQSTHEERVYKFRMQRLQSIKQDIDITRNQIEKARHYVRKDLMPIIDRIAVQKFKYVRILDEAYEKQFFSFKQKEHIRKLIEERSHQLLQQYRFEPARKMYKKYVKHNQNLDADVFNSASDVAKEFAEAVNDLLFDWNKDREENKDKKRFDINEETEGFRIEDFDTGNKKRVVFHSDKKNKPFNTAQALRVLYTRLAKDLHPDLEQDEKRKIEKNDVMRRLTEAYKNEDLYELLQIQFEYNAESTENYTDALPEEQLRVINETLLSQIKKLQEDYKEMTVFGEDAILYRQFCAPNDPKGELTSIKVNRHKEELVFELLDLKDEMQIVMNKEKFEKYLKEL
ncbi:hypothetical protein Fleli_1523 [Bernardetia litoralis DSM 6794]|uniref:DnaJ-like protein n=1 Tax=Bernardetia litoralis (strain ATCC 23117 / DSM 6794 / NBRC 15988 / NCIMB 1366 / Fx l1 / Sio-4) TaxID=880071 RepID=I4AJ10_BERLS|nr:hypothetical protein [Bernardetia litoralis]AFM03945.1 hypothetical protein Fleli_1523 [Bernardetia litoralis DSM 6794]